MSGDLDLEQRYRRVLRLLPGYYRDKWEEDISLVDRRPVSAGERGEAGESLPRFVPVSVYADSRLHDSAGHAPVTCTLSAGPSRSAARPRPELVRQFGHLVAGPFQVRGPRQHALEDRLTAVGELPDHRDVAFDTPVDADEDERPSPAASHAEPATS